jgi:hypothetical protein
MAKLAYVMVLAGLATGACTKEENRCKADADCADPAYPFCDVDGQYAASGGAKGVCTIVPPDCPVDRCGCEPGATSCTSDQLTTCNADGKSQDMVDCTLGCEDSAMSCKTFEPANGLGPALMQASAAQDIVFPSTITVNTDTGAIVDSSNASIAVTSLVVNQGSSAIRVFVGKSFEIQNATVVGTMPVAFVASGPIKFEGLFDASANLASAGPGALELPAPSAGENGIPGLGGGGGGNATSGGSGAPKATSIGPISSKGGAPQTTFEPLIGGARGGDGDASGLDGGGGGGGVEIVSITSIEVVSTGAINIGGGGGGADGSGGGSGGNIILQAPSITVDGTIAANGGSGGAGGLPGNDATADDQAAASVMSTGQLFTASSGSGGTGSAAPTNGQITSGSGTTAAGGGAAGRVLIGTLDGTFARGSTAILSATVTAQMLVTM